MRISCLHNFSGCFQLESLLDCSYNACMSFYAAFETAFGVCGILWDKQKIQCIKLPESTRAKLLDGLLRLSPQATPLDLPEWILPHVEEMRRYLLGQKYDFAKIPLDVSQVPAFHQEVYRAARRIPHGETTTYGELARQAGSPKAARAVGQALAKKSFPLGGSLPPCPRCRK